MILIEKIYEPRLDGQGEVAYYPWEVWRGGLCIARGRAWFRPTAWVRARVAQRRLRGVSALSAALS